MEASEQVTTPEPKTNILKWLGISSIGVLLATIFFVWTGLLEGFRFWLGIIGAPVAFWLIQVGLRQNTDLRRFSNFIAGLAMVWALCVLAVVAYNIVTVGFVYTREANQIRKEQEDLRTSERVRAHGYAGMLEYKLACDKKEEEDTEKAASTIKDTDLLWKRMTEIRDAREKCAKRIINGSEEAASSALSTSAKSARPGSIKFDIGRIFKGDPNWPAIFWVAISIIWVVALVRSIVKRQCDYKFLFLLPPSALLFAWVWWSKGVGAQVIEIVQNIKWF